MVVIGDGFTARLFSFGLLEMTFVATARKDCIDLRAERTPPRLWIKGTRLGTWFNSPAYLDIKCWGFTIHQDTRWFKEKNSV
jgi:hypothetical protein